MCIRDRGEVDAYRDAHQWKDASAAAEEASKALPKNHTIQLMYAGQLADMGQVDEGLALAKAQLTGTPDDRDVETDLAQMYIRLKRFSEASAQMDKADATATKPEEKLYGFFLRGEFYERQKMYDQAEVNFRKALAIDPQNAAVLNYLGYMPVSYTHLDVYKRQGLHNALAVALIGCARGMLRRGIEPRTQHVVRVGGDCAEAQARGQRPGQCFSRSHNCLSVTCALGRAVTRHAQRRTECYLASLSAVVFSLASLTRAFSSLRWTFCTSSGSASARRE